MNTPSLLPQTLSSTAHALRTAEAMASVMPATLRKVLIEWHSVPIATGHDDKVRPPADSSPWNSVEAGNTGICVHC